MKHRTIHSPIGGLLLSAQAGRLCGVRLAHQAEMMDDSDPVLDEAERQLAQYFAGKRWTFDLPLSLEGSAFEQDVWRQLLAIPFGEIRSYGQIAAAIGKPKAFRGVGRACSRNPLLIVVPCHRVVAASGALTGFAAGMAAKKTLLICEGWTIRDDKLA